MTRSIQASFGPEPRPTGLWADLLNRNADVGFTSAVGSLRTRLSEPSGVSEHGSRFWIVAGDRWRVEDDRGEVHIQQGSRCWIRGRRGHLEPVEGGSVTGAAGRWRNLHPHRLLGSPNDQLFRDPHDFHSPSAPPVEVSAAGRKAWEFLLDPPPHKPNPLRVALDAATGACLRHHGSADGSEFLMELVDVEFNVAVDPGRFVPAGRVLEPDLAEQGAERLKHERERFNAYVVASENAVELMQIVFDSANAQAAQRAIADLLDVSDRLANDILKQHLRLFTIEDRRRRAVQLARINASLES